VLVNDGKFVKGGKMGLLADKINEIEKKVKKPKWKILKECCDDDIKEMIEKGVPLRKQIDLILGAGILKKLEMKEYYYILTHYFGYEPRRNFAKVFKIENEKGRKDERGSSAIVTKSNTKSNTSSRFNVKKELAWLLLILLNLHI
jgi:hypothetical protein